MGRLVTVARTALSVRVWASWVVRWVGFISLFMRESKFLLGKIWCGRHSESFRLRVPCACKTYQLCLDVHSSLVM